MRDGKTSTDNIRPTADTQRIGSTVDRSSQCSAQTVEAHGDAAEAGSQEQSGRNIPDQGYVSAFKALNDTR
jgi:hypothetical protein